MRNPLILLPVGLLLLGATLGAQSPFPVEIIESETALGSLPGATLSGYNVAFDGERAAATSSRLSDPLPMRLELFRRGQTEWQREGELNVRGIGGGFGMQLDVSADLLALGDPGENRVYVWKARDDAPPVWNAWNTFDLITGSGSLHYRRSFTPAQHALAASEGWRLTLRGRMVDDFGGSAACYLDFTDANNRRWLLFFNLDDEGDLIVSLGGLETLKLTNDGQGWADYHQHEVRFRPTTGTADYYFNGRKLNTALWASTPVDGLNGVRWGNGSTAGRGSMNFNLVDFRTAVTGEVLARYDAGLAASSAVVPHPADQGWTENRTGANHPGRPVAGDVTPSWQLEAVLTESDYSEARFGASLDLDGDTLVVGHPHAFDGQGSDGAAHVFVRQEGGWIEQQKFWSPLPATTEDFGMLVALAGDTLVIGARSWESDELGATAHVYVRENETWSLQSELLGLPGVAPHFPATALAMHGDLVVVGARWVPPSDLGAVYVFEREGENWSVAGDLRADPPDTFGGFGNSVATDGELIVAGHDDASSAHLFARDGEGRWVQVHRLDLPDWGHLTDVAIADGRFALMVAPPTNDYDDLLVYHIDYANAPGLAAYARRVLYYPEAAASGSMDPSAAVFRYKHLLYTEDNLGIRPNYQAMPALFGDAERRLAEMVKQELERGLALQPEEPALGNQVLDLYYDTAVAQAVFAKEILMRASRIRFGPPYAPEPSANGFAIDLEIPEYQLVLEENREVLQGYFELFTDNLGLQGDPPLGHELFRRLVPGRALAPAEYLDEHGTSQPVVAEATLFDGYKDLVLLFDLLRDHGRAAADLTQLLIARDRPPGEGTVGDREAARRVISDTQRFLLVHGSMLKGIFPGLDPDPADRSGLSAAIDGWSASLTGLTTLQQLLDGDANVLGFAPDFLMLVENFGVDADGIFDSFNSFMARQDPGDDSSELFFALATWQSARDSYDRYLGYQDQLAVELSQTSSITYRDRLRDIVGVFPGHENYGDDPRVNPGSELDQQYRSIERARLVVLKNKTEISNLRRQIQIEIQRAADIADVYIDFGNRRARIEEKMADLNAAQAGANQLTDYLNPVNLVSGASIAIALNFGVQTITELEKGRLEAEKERLAGLEQATIVGIESDAIVKTLLLNMNTLAVESMDAALLLTQEANRLAALYREKADLERALAERRQELASRFFADPSHRLYAENELVRANLAFEEARKWMFFAVRALEYKWNTPFTHVFPAGGRQWTADTVFKLRHAGELELFYRAMANFDLLINRARTPEFDGFSVREDFFGYSLTNHAGETLFHADPQTGEPVTAIEAFRSRLRQLQNAQGDIRIEFNTVRQVPGGTFFVGPRFSNGAVIEKGRFLDKIDYLQIKLPGQHTLGLTSLRGRLTYGGASFIRKFNVGAPDAERPDRLRNELTSYSTRYWFFDPSPGIARWRFTDALTIDSVRMELAPDDRAPPEIDRVLAFKERSVAATGWVLEIPTVSQGTEVLRIDDLNDVEIYFSHFSAQRQ
jgi:hypothetical protein